MGLLCLLWMISNASGSDSTALEAAQFDSALDIQLDTAVGAQAQRVNAVLGEAEAGVLQMQALAEQVLSMPDVFAGELPDSIPFLHPAPAPANGDETAQEQEGTSAEASTPPPVVEEHPLDNPVYYVVGDGGALRKQIDDGHSAVFMMARPMGAAFTRHDAQRLFASAALDPLLANAAAFGGPGAQAYMVTSDSLLRTYPYIDLHQIEDDKDLTGLPFYAWSKPKANARGIVWAGPYLSRFSSTWVVCCMAEVNVGGKILGVTGVELPLASFKERLLSFSLGRNSTAWLMDDAGLVIACQEQAPTVLGLAALADAGLPDDKNPGENIKSAATLTQEFSPEVYGQLEQAASVAAGTTSHKEGILLRSAKVETTGWKLCGRISATLLAEAYTQETSGDSQMRRMLIWIAGVLAIAVLIAFGMSWLEARRISQPLAILTQQVRQAAISQNTTSVVIADDSEVGALAQAVQELVDLMPGEGEVNPPLAPPPQPRTFIMQSENDHSEE